ncbi:fas-associated death domain protein isoform X2 [Ooceraea biroi]|uniref:fas-associated death domain protein isoform X2 n=1 Tax=Ooceraea biroi TaxID=2015173 RepID=UPI0005BE0573|nr:fas-associated death domain protein isoform X2 [Ooceraea biroi]
MIEKRKLSKARDFKTFIRLLEKRDIVSYKNIEPLWFISKQFVRNSNLNDKLLDYENWLETAQLSPSCNMYQSDEAPELLEQQRHEEEEYSASLPESACASTYNLSRSSTENSIASSSIQIIETSHSCRQEGRDNLDDKRKLLQQTVLLQIKDRLGRSWRDVARHLNIRECEIDAVQSKYPYDLKEQSYEFLNIYMALSDTERWAINLIHALEKGRRRDLKELVEELILKNNT